MLFQEQAPASSIQLQLVMIGAAIGFVVSLLTTFAAHIFEARRNRQEHEWERRDVQVDKETAILEKRLSELESLASELLIDAEKARSFLQVLLVIPSYAKDKMADFFSSTAFTTPNANQLQAVAISLGDKELADIAKRLWSRVNTIGDLVGETVQGYDYDHEVGKQTGKQVLDKMALNINALVVTQSELLTQIDLMRKELARSG